MSSDDTTRDFDAGVALADPPTRPATADHSPKEQANLDLLLDVDLQVSVELGRTELKFRDVLNLAAGSVVELGRQTSEPVDILVNGSLLATGEVVVVDDRFAVRITKLVGRADRLKKSLG
jgi:flagellar motor switch protein FliN/FliY